MKYFFLILIALSSTAIFSQENGAGGGFIHLSKVEKPPFSSNCTVNVALCTAKVIEDFLIRKITSSGTLNTTVSGKTEVKTKVIIDTLGQISWASIKGIPSETGKNLAEHLKEMPAFSPGEHKGQKTNVIVDLITPFHFWEKPDFSSEAISFEQADTPPVWRRCKKTDDSSCTHLEVQNWFAENIDVSKLSTPGFYSFTLNFVIGSNGKISRIAFYGGEDNFGNSIIKTVQKMPDFKPAQDAGDPIATYYIMPMTGQRFNN